MHKPFKTLDEQIKHLELNKNIIFGDRERAKQFLYNNNYYNVISAAKIFVCSNCVNGKHDYPQLSFELWIENYLKDCLLSSKVREALINLERNINSKLAYQLSKILEDNVLETFELITFKNKIHGINKKHTNKTYSKEEEQEMLQTLKLQEMWRQINVFHFGDTLELLKWLNNACIKRGRNKKGQILLEYWQQLQLRYTITELYELKNMRNAVSHFTPLTIYLTTSLNQKNIKYKIHLIKRLTKECSMQQDELDILSLMSNKALHFVNIKNQDNKKGD